MCVQRKSLHERHSNVNMSHFWLVKLKMTNFSLDFVDFILFLTMNSIFKKKKKRGAGCRLGWVQTPGGNILRESGDLSLQTP